MELDNHTDISNNANSTVTPCALGVSMPKLTDDHGTNSADEAVLLNDKCVLAGAGEPTHAPAFLGRSLGLHQCASSGLGTCLFAGPDMFVPV
jgi:hypothetical protein